MHALTMSSLLQAYTVIEKLNSYRLFMYFLQLVKVCIHQNGAMTWINFDENKRKHVSMTTLFQQHIVEPYSSR